MFRNERDGKDGAADAGPIRAVAAGHAVSVLLLLRAGDGQRDGMARCRLALPWLHPKTSDEKKLRNFEMDCNK